MAFGLGLKVLRKFCEEQNPLLWQNSKLNDKLFKPHELPAFVWVQEHLKAHHALPNVDTLCKKFPDAAEGMTPEPVSYYLMHLEKAYFHGRINQANLDSQMLLQKDPGAGEQALEILSSAIRDIRDQQYRMKILDVGVDAFDMVLKAYHNKVSAIAKIGWDYLDAQSGGGQAGDVISFVGRPAAGKTWMMLWSAMQNWHLGRDVLFASMEIGRLPMAQRITSLETSCNISQLKKSAFSKHTYDKFVLGLAGMKKHDSKFYVIDGSLAATVDDIYGMADVLGCGNVYIDGGYLVKNRNGKLDRYTRVAENVEQMKRYTEDLQKCSIVSWQFNREASKKSSKSGKQEGSLEDIGYSDAIGQISSIACGMFEEDSVETMLKRKIRVMKGRNGEIGEFSINWDFGGMNFEQCDPPVGGAFTNKECQWI